MYPLTPRSLCEAVHHLGSWGKTAPNQGTLRAEAVTLTLRRMLCGGLFQLPGCVSGWRHSSSCACPWTGFPAITPLVQCATETGHSRTVLPLPTVLSENSRGSYI